jgi:hypothetical protein
VKTLARPRDKAEVLRRLRTVGPESARHWGRMTAHQMVCHLGDAFRMGTGDKAVSDATSLFHRTIVKWVVLYAPLRWPPGIHTRPEIDACLGGTQPAAFAADVAALEALVEHVTAPARSFEWRPHPLFGRMSHAAWLRWGYLHMDHHLRQFGA